jgi:choline dehydrogenase
MVAGFLTDDRDVPPLIEGIRVIRRIFDEPPFKQHSKGETHRGIEFRTDEQLIRHLRANAQSMYHPVGTCGMGSGDDAAVDHELRVRGIEGLRVVDASVMPGIPSGNTNARRS